MKHKAFRLDTKQDFLPVWMLKEGWGGDVSPAGTEKGLGLWRGAKFSVNIRKELGMIRDAQRTEYLPKKW